MNLIWHIVKKDLRAMRWPLLVWAALIAAKLLIGVVIFNIDGAGDSQLFNTLDGLGKLMAGLECFGVVLVAALVQEDMLVGTTAFWITRPISGGRLLGAKLLALVIIFGALPVLVTLPWWLGSHLSARQIAVAAAETAVLHLLVVLLGLLWAVITDGLGRFLLWLLAFVVAIPMTAAIIASCLGRMNAVVTSDLATTRVVVVAGVLLLGIAFVVGHQFLTRRTWRSVSMVGAMIALILTIALGWPWSWSIESKWRNFLGRQAEKAWPVGAEPPGLSFVAGSGELLRRPSSRVVRPVQLRVKGQVSGLRSNQTLIPGVGNYILRWTDGITNEGWTGVRAGKTLHQQVWYDSRALTFLGPSALEVPTNLELQATQFFPEKIAAQLEKDPAAYILQARFALIEFDAETTLPLAPNRRIMNGPIGERIGSIQKEGETVAVTIARHRPALLSDYLAEMSSYVLGAGRDASYAPGHYRLVNRARNFVDTGSDQVIHTSRIAGVELSWETKTYRAMRPDGSSKARLEAMQALEAAELSRVTFHSRGNFIHELKVDPLVVEPATP